MGSDIPWATEAEANEYWAKQIVTVDKEKSSPKSSGPSVPSGSVPSGSDRSKIGDTTQALTQSVTVPEPSPNLTTTTPTPLNTNQAPPESVKVPGPCSPNVTMTTPTPLNSQEGVQETTILVTPIARPAHAPTPANTLVPPPIHDGGSRRRSPRLQGNSRGPSPASDAASKRPSEDEDGGDSKRQKLLPT